VQSFKVFLAISVMVMTHLFFTKCWPLSISYNSIGFYVVFGNLNVVFLSRNDLNLTSKCVWLKNICAEYLKAKIHQKLVYWPSDGRQGRNMKETHTTHKWRTIYNKIYQKISTFQLWSLRTNIFFFIKKNQMQK